MGSGIDPKRLMRKWKTLLSPRRQTAGKIPRPCQMDGLFIRHTGDVFPCCLVWGRKDMRIGNVNDKNIVEKIRRFNAACSCERFRFRKATPDDRFNLFLNIEFSLACQGNCIMCCVEAPSWSGTYDSYDGIESIIDQCAVSEVLVQGGEVLIQKKSMEWIEKIRGKRPELKFALVTNGNVGVELVRSVEEMFREVVVSIAGFEPETYRKIMGMDLGKTVRFAGDLCGRRTVDVNLKYLVTPINLHESNLFLEWAVSLGPGKCHFADASVSSYINMNTRDRYWEKIIAATGKEIRGTILGSKTTLAKTGMRVGFDTKCREIFGIDDSFVKENGLGDIIYWSVF